MIKNTIKILIKIAFNAFFIAGFLMELPILLAVEAVYWFFTDRKFFWLVKTVWKSRNIINELKFLETK